MGESIYEYECIATYFFRGNPTRQNILKVLKPHFQGEKWPAKIVAGGHLALSFIYTDCLLPARLSSTGPNVCVCVCLL